ncbi:MAG: NAD-dependent epimerase/dehydratase family protein [Candidatus Kryptoniota bacterium]
MRINAIIFGATGMVGEGVLHECLKHPSVDSVLVINRRPCNVEHRKLKELIHDDFHSFSKIEEHLKGYNACYFCLGITSVWKSEKDYTAVTYDLTMQAAETLSRLSPEMIFCYVSGEGTDGTGKGRLMWSRVKGKTENDLMKLPFKAAYMFRPGFIKPIRGLKNAYGVSRVLGLFYPVLRRLLPKHVCTLEDLGTAMINVTMNGFTKNILENKDIDELGLAKRVP